MDFLKNISIRPEDCETVIAALVDSIHRLERSLRSLERQLDGKDHLIEGLSAERMEGMNDV